MKTSVRDTSILAYRSEVSATLGPRHKAVYELLERKYEGMTNSEIACALGWPINTVTPRVSELRGEGKGGIHPALVEEDCKRTCRITGRTAWAWRVIRHTLF